MDQGVKRKENRNKFKQKRSKLYCTHNLYCNESYLRSTNLPIQLNYILNLFNNLISSNQHETKNFIQKSTDLIKANNFGSNQDLRSRATRSRSAKPTIITAENRDISTSRLYLDSESEYDQFMIEKLGANQI